MFGERGISEESPDPEINGQSNPFTITLQKTDGSRCTPAAGRAASETRAPPWSEWGLVGEGPAPLRGKGRRHSREGVRGDVPEGGRKAARGAVGGMVRCAPSPDRSLRVPHGQVGEEGKEGEFQA